MVDKWHTERKVNSRGLIEQRGASRVKVKQEKSRRACRLSSLGVLVNQVEG